MLKEFNELDAQITLTADKADEIKAQVDQMVELNNKITTTSNNLADVSSTNAAASEEMNANIEELNAMMHNVQIWLRKCRISQMNLILHLNILNKIDSL